MIRFVRRPAFPGETNHELVWPGVFIGFNIFAFIFFALGGTSPGCLFFNFTGIPCLGCGATRCARELSHLDFWSAFKYNPGVFTLYCLGVIWTIYSAVFWLRRDHLRLRLSFNENNRSVLLKILFLALFVHWLWQCYYLRNK